MVYTNGSVASYDSDKNPKYPLEHLATFKISKETGILKPSDGMKKLVKLGDTSGIWPHKMLISFDPDWVLIMDYETGATIEGFPGNLIQQPTAFTSDDPNEVFNNILIFIVGGSLSHTDMHIFHCITVSAVNLVADLQAISKGQVIKKHHEQYPLTPIKKTTSQNNMRDQYGLKEMNSISANSQQFDIDLLNHCIIDIEKFVSRLHNTTVAGQELERRRQSRGQNGVTYGEGLLRTRSQRPVETEFLDILAKFKLALNLIAKLKTQIKVPQTPIHHLFTSLELIVEIANEECEEKNLPEQVISPLFFMDTINLLNKTLNVREKNLWYSCGPPWNVPKEQWQGRVASYYPVFSDGWCPDMPAEADDNLSLMSLPMTLRNGGSDNESVITVTPDRGLWLAKLENKRALIALVKFDRAASNEKELTVHKGEYLEVLNDSRKWWKARNSSSQIGYVPHTILTLHELPQEPINYRNSPAENIGRSLQAEEIHRKALERRSVSMPNPPPPPPPMPPSEPTTPYATLKKSAAIVAVAEINNNNNNQPEPETPTKRFTPENKNMTQDELNNELQLIFALKKNREDINIKQLPDVYIDERSSAQDVAEWLRQKDFSENVVKKLEHVNGRDLFGIQLETLIEYFGPKTGRRLDGMIIIQKKHCKFQTAGKSELKAILARARQKTGEAEEVF